MYPPPAPSRCVCSALREKPHLGRFALECPPSRLHSSAT